MYSIREFLALYSLFQVTSNQIKSLLGQFWSPEITWGHFLSRDCLFLRATDLRKWNEQYTRVFDFLQPLSGDFRSNDVTPGHSGHLRSHDIISCHVTASFCKLQPCRKWKGQYTRVFYFYSHFQVTSNQMTSLSGHLRYHEITWRHFLSGDCLLLRATAL